MPNNCNHALIAEKENSPKRGDENSRTWTRKDGSWNEKENSPKRGDENTLASTVRSPVDGKTYDVGDVTDGTLLLNAKHETAHSIFEEAVSADGKILPKFLATGRLTTPEKLLDANRAMLAEYKKFEVQGKEDEFWTTYPLMRPYGLFSPSAEFGAVLLEGITDDKGKIDAKAIKDLYPKSVAEPMLALLEERKR